MVSESIELHKTNNLVFLPGLRVLQLQGPGAAEFLQGYVSCDTKKLNSENPLFGAMCDIKGRVIASFYLIEIDEIPSLLTHSDTVEKVLDHLEKYLVFSKCKIVDVSNTCVILGRIQTSPMGPHPRKLHISNQPGFIRLSLDKDAQRQILICEPEKAQQLWSTADAHPGEHVWHLADLYSGIILPDLGSSGLHLPQSLNMTAANEAIDFNKGCYLGQEIIARVEHRGAVKRHLAIYAWQAGPDNIPKAGDDITNFTGKVLGKVCQCVVKSAGEGLLAGIIRLPGTNETPESHRVGNTTLIPIDYQG